MFIITQHTPYLAVTGHISPLHMDKGYVRRSGGYQGYGASPVRIVDDLYVRIILYNITAQKRFGGHKWESHGSGHQTKPGTVVRIRDHFDMIGNALLYRAANIVPLPHYSDPNIRRFNTVETAGCHQQLHGIGCGISNISNIFAALPYNLMSDGQWFAGAYTGYVHGTAVKNILAHCLF